MKSIRSAALVAALCAALTACGLPVNDDPGATASPMPSASTPGAASTVPSPSPVAVPQYTSDVIDDGIAADEYPPLAAERGEGFPAAYEMQDWVWDKAGAGWSVAIVTDSTGWEEDGSPLQPAEVYLVSTEGAYFDLFALPIEYSDPAIVATWRESERVAMVLWAGGAGELNLDTGVMDPLEFRMGEGKSLWVNFLASDDDGVELWSAGDGTQTRYFRWSPARGYEAVLEGQTDIQAWYSYQGSPRGEWVAFEVWSQGEALASERSGTAERPRYVVYSLTTGEARLVAPAWPPDATSCSAYQWSGPETFRASCSYPGTASVDYLELAVDMSTGAVSETPASASGSLEYAQEAIHDAAEVALANGVILVSEPNSSAVFEVRVTTTSGIVTVADSTNYLLRSGGSLAGAVEVAPGVLRLALATTVLLIDLGTGQTVALRSARTAAGDPTLWTTLAFYGESAAEGIGSFGCGC